MPHVDDLSRSLTAFDQDSTLVAVIEMSLKSWLPAGIVPGVSRAARSLRLDPLRRQVHAFAFNKHDPKKRRLSLVTSIEGFRAIAARTGNYCPDENEPAFVSDDLKTEINPAGLVSCAVRVWQYAHGQWFPITGVARWDEFAPL